MRIYINGEWHKGCSACGEILEECACDKEESKEKEIEE